MAVRKTKAGANLKRWFKEKWKDEKGKTINLCSLPGLQYTSSSVSLPNLIDTS